MWKWNPLLPISLTLLINRNVGTFVITYGTRR